MFPVSRFSVKELKIKEIDRQIEEQRSSERALAEQEEDQEKDAQRAANVGKMGSVTGEKWEKLGNGVQTICEIYGKIWTCFIHERCLLGYPQFQGFLILAREVIWGWGMASVLSSNIHTFLPTSNH